LERSLKSLTETRRIFHKAVSRKPGRLASSSAPGKNLAHKQS